MRRILFPLLVIGLAAGLFTLGSGAFFSDVESDTGNVITAGTADLVIGSTTSACDYSNVYPGQTLSACSITLNMNGTLDNLHLDAELHTTGVADSGFCGEFCNGAANLTAGDILITACTYDGGACPFTNTGSGDFTLGEIEAQGCKVLDADADALDDGKILSLTFQVATTVGNTAQGDGISIDLHFGLSQSADASPNRCHPSGAS